MYPWPVKIFTRCDMPRLRYAAGIIFTTVLGVPYELVTDKRKLGNCPVINYSDEEVKGAFRITPAFLMEENGIKPHNLSVTLWKGLPVIFETDSRSDIPFDIFSAVFYMVSRYEEYLDFDPDIHGRFPAHQSLAYRNGFLDRPVVNLWIKEFTKLLVVRFPGLVFRKNSFRKMVTFDVDEPFKYLGKGVIRNLGGLFSDMGKKEPDPMERLRTVSGKLKDPWDNFDYLIIKAAESGSEIRFFFPAGDRSRFDRWPAWNNHDYRGLITSLASKIPSGLHPSYYSTDNPELLAEEKKRLDSLIPEGISSSRYHYLRLRFPSSYSSLLTAGITEDYSMGFPDEPGFRAGISVPYDFYDLKAEKITNLRIYPFQVMDATLMHYKMMNPEDAEILIMRLIDETKNAGGLFQTVWHNNNLAEGERSNRWQGVFENILNYPGQ